MTTTPARAGRHTHREHAHAHSPYASAYREGSDSETRAHGNGSGGSGNGAGRAKEEELGEEHSGLGDEVEDGEDADMASLDDTSDAALIAQTLNADGTPKRPMNAFMIFARRRRPQVSAANQMMRTGEISKILSREWGGMAMSEKQFYLDQAKKLKDAFNNKYPDYVYRRRPNNTRRRRRSDSASGGAVRGPQPADDHDDIDADRDDGFESASPVEYRSSGSLGGGLGHSGGMGGGGGLGGHIGYDPTSHVIVHPAAGVSGAGPGNAPTLSLSGLSSLGGGLAPPSAYGRPPFTPMSASTSSGTGASAGENAQPVSPMSPYARYSPYSPATPATSVGTGGGLSYSGTGPHGYGSDDFGGGPGGANGSGGGGRLSALDWPSDHHSSSNNAQQQQQQPHSAYPHSPADTSSHGNMWGRFDRPSSNAGAGVGGVPASWPLSNLTTTTLPPPSGPRTATRPFGSAGGLNLSLGNGASEGRARDNKELFNPAPPTASGRRERAWSTTPSNTSTSSASPSFPTLTEPFHPSSQQQHQRGSSASSSPSVGLTRGSGGSGDLYDTPQPHSAYPISPISPYAAMNSSHGHGGAPQTQGSRSSLHPIATYGGSGGGGTGPGSLSPRDVSPLSAVSPHSAVSHAGNGGSGFWGER